MSKTYSEVVKFFKKMDKELTCDKFKGSASLYHRDGSRMHYNSAFIVRRVCCFTEHHGPRVYHFDDLDGYDEWTKNPSRFFHDLPQSFYRDATKGEGGRKNYVRRWRNSQ